MADATDINVDELRRRARRRLIGAVVLALTAAVIVPMLLESEPKPLGEDVSVKIPAEDGGKFVNRLSDKSAKAPAVAPAAKSEPAKETAKESAKESASEQVREPAREAAKADAAPPAAAAPESVPAVSNVPPPKKSIAQAEQKMLGTPAKSAATAAPPAAAPVVAPVPTPTPAPVAAPATSAPTTGAATSTPATGTATSATKDAGKAAGGESFSVQLAAFADDKGANALANKLKRATYPAYTEPLTTSKGTLWRVRVGPYPSRDAAVEVRDKLKSEGYSGIVAVAK
jgi:DedD protein